MMMMMTMMINNDDDDDDDNIGDNEFPATYQFKVLKIGSGMKSNS